MRRHRRISLVLVLGGVLAWPAAASDIGQEVAAQIDVPTYRHYLDDLLYTHAGQSRGRLGAEHDLARTNIVDTFTSFGLAVELFPFTYQGQTYFNVIASQPGLIDADVQYVIGAHYDSTNNPGADDDASGVAAVMEIARVLSQYDTGYTIKYCAWDLEELGLLGSTAYVDARRADDIRAMVQIDMIARDAGLNRQDLYAGTPALELRDALGAAFPLYGNGVQVQYNAHSGFSDHAPFYNAGYPAVCFVEDNYLSNACYHQPCDHVDQANYINYDFACNLTRVVAGYLADHALAFQPGDCDDDGVADAVEIAADAGLDCNGNGMLDACEPGVVRDCNNNGTPDVCEIETGAAVDADLNGIPDACQTTRRVPNDYATIQAAITAAVSGDTVLVAPGTYTGTGNKNLDFMGKVLLLRSEGGPATCTIDCQNSGRAFVFQRQETPLSVVDGLTLTGGRGAGGGAIQCLRRSSPTIKNCVLTGNSTSSGGGGAIEALDRSDPRIVNCVIQGNTTGTTGGGMRLANGACPIVVNTLIAGNTAASGGAVSCTTASSPTFTNCTIARNHANGVGGGIATTAAACLVTVANSIVWSNTATSLGAQIHIVPTTSLAASFSNVQGGQAGVTGGGSIPIWLNNIAVDPLFADGPAHDYHLLAGSACIDAAATTAVATDFADLDGDADATEPTPRDLDGGPRFRDDAGAVDCGQAPGACGAAPLADMGAYEFRPACPGARGDANCDGSVDFFDIDPFLLALFDAAGYVAMYCGGSTCAADADCGGSIDFFDIDAFLACVFDGCASCP